MKLSRHVFTASWGVHAWAGVVAALLLHVMFLTGAVTLWKTELTLWQEPLARAAHVERSHQETLDFVVGRLGFTPEDLWILYPEGHDGAVAVAARQTLGSPWKHYLLDDTRGQVVEERETLAELIYHLHFLWHDSAPVLYYLAGLLSVGLLLALATGVLIHLKDLRRQFHQFRPHKGSRVLFSDLHKVLGVMGLPFQAFYAYSGAFFVLSPFIVAALNGPVFHGDAARAQALAFGLPPLIDAEVGTKARVLDLDQLVARAVESEPRIGVHALNVHLHGENRGIVQVHGDLHGTPFGESTVRLRETDGTVLEKQVPETALNGKLQRWLLGVHFAHFGGNAARILFTLLALATCATLLTGNWIWLTRRQAQASSLGHRVLAQLTVGLGAGTLVALAALFLLSRVLPLSLPGRVRVEELTFLGVLGVCVVVALCAERPGALWRPYLALAGLFAAITPVAALRITEAGLFGRGATNAAVRAVDSSLVLVGLALIAVAVSLRKRSLARSAELGAGSVLDAPAGELDHG